MNYVERRLEMTLARRVYQMPAECIFCGDPPATWFNLREDKPVMALCHDCMQMVADLMKEKANE